MHIGMQQRVSYTVEEAAALLGISRTKLYECVRTGEVEATPVGRRWLIPAAALEELLGRPLPGSTRISRPGSETEHNDVKLIGRVTKDADLRESKTGRTVVVLRLAVRRRHGDDAMFIDVVAFEEEAKRAANLVKGQRIRVAGRLDQREWVAEDGTRRHAHQVVAQHVEALEPTREDPRAR
ncbi:MAG: single-stranded DNA-binding protein [Actinomycetota bacterium]